MKRSILAAGAVLAMASPVLAHHGWSSYDADKTIKASGKLTDVNWGNPHGSAKIEYQGKTWDVILAPVARMEARGLTKAMVGPDRTVTLEGYPRRDGTAEMRIERITAGDKTVELR
jgi:Family of unknown function (DUF6152)